MFGRLLKNESDEYIAARDALRQAEIDLKEQRERVAELRRALPEGPEVEDYVFAELGPGGDATTAALSTLFEDPDKPLVVDHFMYGETQTDGCPMCSMWADGYNAVYPHLAQHMNFVVVADAAPAKLNALAGARGWNHLRMLSSGDTPFKKDFAMVDDKGVQRPGISVFVRDGDRIRHTYSCTAVMAEGHWRGVDLLSPVWNMLDLLPGGRGDWWPSLRYD